METPGKEAIMKGMTPTQREAYLKSEALHEQAGHLINRAKSGYSAKATALTETANEFRKKAGLIEGELT